MANHCASVIIIEKTNNLGSAVCKIDGRWKTLRKNLKKDYHINVVLNNSLILCRIVDSHLIQTLNS